MVRTAAIYVDRIIKGEKPGDLPMQQPIPARTHRQSRRPRRRFGLELPQSLMVRADEMID